MDGEFRAVQKLLPLIELNITAAREHVPEIESGIRRVKEKVRCFSSEWVYQYIPTLLIIHTVYTAAFFLNSFVIGSDNYGFAPCTTMTGMALNYARDCKTAPGEYIDAVVDREVTNTNEA